MGKMTLSVNGNSVEVDVAGEMPLLWVLREQLGLTGTKYGCDSAQCGACTVHIDGQAQLACQVTAAAAVGKKIKTIEGLGVGPLHPVQQAWVDEHVPQCGYCQPGQIMAAVALLEKTPKPSAEDIDRAMSGNICRCGTYPRIKKAIRRASAGMNK
jgi:aerobic-type carbon monoxide dehydrogenase small subunit (CoxS/CutS family)